LARWLSLSGKVALARHAPLGNNIIHNLFSYFP
jgi:hypothetical protein